MQKTWTLLWILLPVAALAWHYGPGQADLARDQASDHWRLAESAEASGNWKEAAKQYQLAHKALPEEAVHERRRLSISHAKARIQNGEMIPGQEQLIDVIAEMEEDKSTAPALMAAARSELAAASYYAAWLMRMEGATAEEWKPEAERARQQFRLLAETGQIRDASVLESVDKNLEATIRLEQMDLSTLLAQPPPKNCPKNCKSLSQRKRKQCQSRCQSDGKKKKKENKDEKKQNKKKKEKKDGRKEIKKAGASEREEGGS